MLRLEHKKLGEYHVFTSPDVTGLYVAHRDFQTARAALEPQIEALTRMVERRANEANNKGVAVGVA